MALHLSSSEIEGDARLRMESHSVTGSQVRLRSVLLVAQLVAQLASLLPNHLSRRKQRLLGKLFQRGGGVATWLPSRVG